LQAYNRRKTKKRAGGMAGLKNQKTPKKIREEIDSVFEKLHPVFVGVTKRIYKQGGKAKSLLGH
jgi:hypothetical protein